MTFLKSLENMFRQRTPSREQAKSIRPTMDELKKLGPHPSEKQMRELFMRAVCILNDTDLQNADYPKLMYLDYDDGPETTPDELPNVQGEFGRSADNPIPVNGTTGELTYLSKLVTENGQRLAFHRGGSTDSEEAIMTLGVPVISPSLKILKG